MLLRQAWRRFTLISMVVHECSGYTRGCRCPRCGQRRADQERRTGLFEAQARSQLERRAQLRQRQAVLREAVRQEHERETPDHGRARESGPLSSADDKPADLLPRRIEREYAHVKRLHGQLAALRDLLATALPGPDSGELTFRQIQQLAELLERQRDELRAVLNGEATLDGSDTSIDPDAASDSGLL